MKGNLAVLQDHRHFPSFNLLRFFTVAGVDFAGPLYVRGENGMRKVWICLHTCCVVRAIHLELLHDQANPALIRSFWRLVARMLVTISIQCSQSSMVGWGVWAHGEMCQRYSRQMIEQAKLTLDEIVIAVSEVEMVLNSRPLILIPAEDLEKPPKPSHLIVERRLMPKTASCPEPDEFQPITLDILTRRARYHSTTIYHLRQRWKKKYLVEPREMHSHYKGSSWKPRVVVGDVVVIHNDDQPRGMWKLGKVEELMTSPDGEQRAAILRVSKGRTAKHLRRPVQRLYPLEMSVLESQPAECDKTTSAEDGSPPQQPSFGPNLNPTLVRCSEWAAAQKARDWLMAQALESDEGECWPSSWSTTGSVRELKPFKAICCCCIMSLYYLWETGIVWKPYVIRCSARRSTRYCWVKLRQTRK